VAAGRPIICGVQSESLRRLLVFHQVLLCGRDNAIGIFREFLVVISLTGRTIVMDANFWGTNERRQCHNRSLERAEPEQLVNYYFGILCHFRMMEVLDQFVSGIDECAAIGLIDWMKQEDNSFP
jgi:hypothetical protein